MERSQLGREFYELGLRLGKKGAVAVGCGGGSLARALARTVGCGAALAGAEVKFHDGTCAACGAWLAEYYDIPAWVFVRQEQAQVSLYLSEEKEKRYSTCSPNGTCTGEWDLLAGADGAWASNRAGGWLGELGPACAQGPAALTLALERLGYEVSAQDTPGAPLFRTDREGFALQTAGCGGVLLTQGADALESLADFVRQPRAVPAFSPETGRAES